MESALCPQPLVPPTLFSQYCALDIDGWVIFKTRGWGDGLVNKILVFGFLANPSGGLVIPALGSGAWYITEA